MIYSCKNEADFRTLLSDSKERPVLLLKHSTRCPISAGARMRFEQYAEEHADIPCWQVLVVEDRPLSLQIAVTCGVHHQSPQVILFHEGQAAWHASHSAINARQLNEAICEKCGE